MKNIKDDKSFDNKKFIYCTLYLVAGLLYELQVISFDQNLSGLSPKQDFKGLPWILFILLFLLIASVVNNLPHFASNLKSSFRKNFYKDPTLTQLMQASIKERTGLIYTSLNARITNDNGFKIKAGRYRNNRGHLSEEIIIPVSLTRIILTYTKSILKTTFSKPYKIKIVTLYIAILAAITIRHLAIY